MVSMWIQEKLNKQSNERWAKRKERTEQQKKAKRTSDALYKEGFLTRMSKNKTRAYQNGEDLYDT